MVIVNASSSFLIDKPISTLAIPTTIQLSISHHRMVIINASSSFLIDKPISTLAIPTTIQLSISHH